MQPSRLSIISGSGCADRINEDGWLVLESPPGWIICAVLDGASIRISLPSLIAHLSQRHGIDNPAVWATDTVRKSLYSQLNAKPGGRLDEAFIRANTSLRSSLEELPAFETVFRLLARRPITPLPEAWQECTGLLRAEIEQAFTMAFPDGSWRQLDSRYLRLVLPVCVVTTVRLNLSSETFDYAHVGDTALMQVDAAGNDRIVTCDQMGKFDDAVLEMATSALYERKSDLRGVVGAYRELPVLRQANLLNGVRHNYVATDGRTQPEAGCGVMNGLSEIGDYIQTGNGPLASGERLYLMSDGLMLPMSRYDKKALSASMLEKLDEYKSALKSGGLAQLYQVVREIEAMDPWGATFQRLKQRDDATGIVISAENLASEILK